MSSCSVELNVSSWSIELHVEFVARVSGVSKSSQAGMGPGINEPRAVLAFDHRRRDAFWHVRVIRERPIIQRQYQFPCSRSSPASL